MKTTSKMINIMQAYVRGEQIEIYCNNKWILCKHPKWDWESCDYRIKSKPKYVPFETVNEFLIAQSIHGRGIIVFGDLYTESYIDYWGNVFLYKRSTINNWTFTFEELFEKCKFQDGTPCGKEVKE